MRQVNVTTRNALVAAIAGRYAWSGRLENGRILDEFVVVTKMHRRPLAHYGAMESARHERLASEEAHRERKAEPASAGSIYNEATNGRSGTLPPETIRIPILIVAPLRSMSLRHGVLALAL